MSALTPWLVGVCLLLVIGIVLLACGWPGLAPHRGNRRAAPGFVPVQLPGLPPMATSDVDGEHDWDGFLRALTAAEPEPTLREQQIEIPREGETTP